MNAMKFLRLSSLGLACLFVSRLAQTQTFADVPKNGASSINVIASANTTVALYQLLPSDFPASGAACDPSKGTLLQIAVSGASPANSLSLSGAGPIYPISLVQPLVPGTGLCIAKISGAALTGSDFKIIKDDNDFGRVRTYLTVGVQISNQQPSAVSGSSQSSTGSTAGEYVEAGFISSVLTAQDHRWRPGLQTALDVRMSPIPVSAPSATSATSTTSATASSGTTTTTTTTTAPTISSLNLLTSQQSARVEGQIYFPIKLTGWQSRYNVFTIAPIAQAGFTTLLNPSATSTTAQGMTATATFSPTYSNFGYGGRLAWDQYSTVTDEAPKMVTQLDVMLSKYSSLPSYLCTSNASKTAVSSLSGLTPGTNTACGSGNTASPYNGLVYISRTLAYRLDITGVAKLPNYPFLVGINANLAQYTIGHNADIDYLNKPGNDIRVFIGLTIPFSSLGSLITTGSVK
jgi:hypothetical protein